MGALSREDAGACHYVYERTRTYRKFEENGENFMSLNINELSTSCGRGAGEKGTRF
jgi:hypothetical protein